MGTTYETLGTLIGKVCDEKNKAYGSSFESSAAFLQALFPRGIQPEQYVHLGLLCRMYDKMARVANGHYEDSYSDIVGYGLLGERLVRAAAVQFESTDVPKTVVAFAPSSDTRDDRSLGLIEARCLLCDLPFASVEEREDHHFMTHAKQGY